MNGLFTMSSVKVYTHILALSIIAPLLFWAAPNALANNDLQYHRTLYQDALHALRTGNQRLFVSLSEELRRTNYPLVLWLEYFALQRHVDSLAPKTVLAFYHQYRNSPAGTLLYQKWLHALAKRKDWKTYSTYYIEDVSTEKLQCHYLSSIYHTSRQEEALEMVYSLWDFPYSRSSACDDIFAVWLKSSHFTPYYFWARFTKTLQKNNQSLLRYLISIAPSQHKDLKRAIDHLILVDRQPHRIENIPHSVLDSQYGRFIIQHALLSMPKNKIENTKRYLKKFKKYLTDSEVLAVNFSIDTASISNKKNQPVQYYKNIIDKYNAHPSLKLELLEDLSKLFLRQTSWDKLVHSICWLPEKEQLTNKWKYWLARALLSSEMTYKTLPKQCAALKSTVVIALQDKSEQINDAAKMLLKELSQELSFYGLLAGSYNKQLPTVPNIPTPAYDKGMYRKVEYNDNILRSKELFILEDHLNANREWQYGLNSFNRQEKIIAAVLAHNIFWHYQSIRACILAQYWNDFDIRFPLGHFEIISSAATHFSLPMSLIYSVIRQESSFRQTSRSSAGALGLMQLLPSTAYEVAKNNNIHVGHSSNLLKPELNIKIGAGYLHFLLERFNNNKVFATAAYNAGPTRLAQWKHQFKGLPQDVFIELIPFSETRKYVKNTLLFSYIYHTKLHPSRDKFLQVYQQELSWDAL